MAQTSVIIRRHDGKIVKPQSKDAEINQENRENRENIEVNGETEKDEGPTPYTLSTVTATGSIGCYLNLMSLYQNIHIDDLNDSSTKRDGFTYIEWGQKNNNTMCKGFHKKMFINHKTRIEGKRFDKQASVILRKYNPISDTYLYQNVKIFYNGSVQITGLKSIDQGMWVLKYLIDTLKEHKTRDSNAYYNEEQFGENALKPHNYIIRLINTDFKLGYFVNRRALDQLMNNYGMFHVFEAGHYPGVKISFYWNKNKEKQNGVCECPDKICSKRGKILDTKNACKKITVIVFQSGSVIITGAQEMRQIDDTYACMNEIFSNIKNQIKKTILRQQSYKKYPKFSYDEISKKRKIRLPRGYVYQE